MNLHVKKKPAIPTERLVLKSYARADAARLTELLTNHAIAQSFMLPEFQTEAQAFALTEKLIAFSRPEDVHHLEYGIYLNGLLIGFINDCGIEADSIEIGYVIHPDHQGYGYATEAVRAVICGLREMGFHVITAAYFEDNAASRRVMEKCGMQPSGLVREETYRGKLHRCIYCEIRL